MTMSRPVFIRMRNILDSIHRENQNTRFKHFFFSVKRVIYEIMWKNTAGPVRPQMT